MVLSFAVLSSSVLAATFSIGYTSSNNLPGGALQLFGGQGTAGNGGALFLMGGSGTLELTGASLNVSGAATVASLTVTGAANVGSITVVGNTTVSGNIRVNGQEHLCTELPRGGDDHRL